VTGPAQPGRPPDPDPAAHAAYLRGLIVELEHDLMAARRELADLLEAHETPGP